MFNQNAPAKKRMFLNDVPLVGFFPCLKTICKKDYFRDRRVLLVEDDRTMLWTVSSVIEEKCLLAVAQDAERAMILYKLFLPDMVLLDVGLPGKDGLTFLEELKKVDKHAYVVIFSGKGEKKIVSKAKDLGAIDFISKPFNPDSKEKILEHLRNCSPHA